MNLVNLKENLEDALMTKGSLAKNLSSKQLLRFELVIVIR